VARARFLEAQEDETDLGYVCRAIEQLRACRPIPEAQVRELCYKAREILIEEGNVVNVDAPVTVSSALVSLTGYRNIADVR